MTQQRFRTIFVSDLHLGSQACQVNYLKGFLENTECETLYLVGDVVDIISMRKRFYFPTSHQVLLQLLLAKAKSGVRVIYIPGNHDEFFRSFCGSTISGIEIKENDEHITADGRRFYVSHGDEFDSTVHCSAMLLFIGEIGHNTLLALNRWINGIRKFFGGNYWSLSFFIKTKISKAVEYIRRYETAAINYAKHHGYDGFICGHADLVRKDNVLYCNDGDWVEHCTSLVEKEDGSLHIMHWSDQNYIVKSEPIPEMIPAIPLPTLPKVA